MVTLSEQLSTISTSSWRHCVELTMLHEHSTCRLCAFTWSFHKHSCRSGIIWAKCIHPQATYSEPKCYAFESASVSSGVVRWWAYNMHQRWASHFTIVKRFCYASVMTRVVLRSGSWKFPRLTHSISAPSCLQRDGAVVNRVVLRIPLFSQKMTRHSTTPNTWHRVGVVVNNPKNFSVKSVATLPPRHRDGAVQPSSCAFPHFGQCPRQSCFLGKWNSSMDLQVEEEYSPRKSPFLV